MSKTKIVYVDENMPHHIAESLNILQEPLNFKEKVTIEVRSIMKEFGQGAKDEEWIPKLDKNSYVITQDRNIQSTRHQKDLYEKYGIGMFFIKAPKNGWSYWEFVKFVINHWEQIKSIIKKSKTPFAFRATAKKKFESFD